MTCVSRRSDHLSRIRATAIPRVPCLRADTCGMEGAPPRRVAASFRRITPSAKNSREIGIDQLEPVEAHAVRGAAAVGSLQAFLRRPRFLTMLDRNHKN